jgi:hypothetical protein
MRQKGYGHWISTAMTKLKEFNTFLETQLASGKKRLDLEEEYKQLEGSVFRKSDPIIGEHSEEL